MNPLQSIQIFKKNFWEVTAWQQTCLNVTVAYNKYIQNPQTKRKYSKTILPIA
jgi:hypothetical protein